MSDLFAGLHIIAEQRCLQELRSTFKIKIEVEKYNQDGRNQTSSDDRQGFGPKCAST